MTNSFSIQDSIENHRAENSEFLKLQNPDLRMMGGGES